MSRPRLSSEARTDRRPQLSDLRGCVTGDTLVTLHDGETVAIGQIVPGARPGSEHEIDLKVAGLLGDPVRASRLFHSGTHPTLRIVTEDGPALTGSHNHPVLCLATGGG